MCVVFGNTNNVAVQTPSASSSDMACQAPPSILTAIVEPSSPSYVIPSVGSNPSIFISTDTATLTKQEKSSSQEPQSLGISQEPSSAVAPKLSSKLQAVGSVHP